MAEGGGRMQNTTSEDNANKSSVVDHTKGKTEEDECPAVTTKDTSEPEDVMAKNKTKAEQLLALGIECLEKDEDREALNHLTEAIALDASNPLLFINRAAAYARLKNYDDAMEDAETVVEMRPDWPEMQKAKNGTVYPKPPTHPLMDKSAHKELRRNSFTRDFMSDPEFVDMLNRMRRDYDLWLEVQNSEDTRYMVASTVAMAFEVNAEEVDWSDTQEKEKHNEDLERFSYPYVQSFEAVREVVIPASPPAPPEVKRSRTPPPVVKYPKGCEIDGSPLFSGVMDMRIPSFSLE
ncbi:uncharacterized protein LOC135113109 isoform X2 [Scylla paramamosain]|uniref:uncharacterized protein LOC135113109 isoform X2 n=1 Tax=Scylla paramamosain TaxID=85552 RepID=UPI0030829EA6